LETLDNIKALRVAHKEEEDQFIVEQVPPRISREDQEVLMAELQKQGMGASTLSFFFADHYLGDAGT
jgi:hypothetical protein